MRRIRIVNPLLDKAYKTFLSADYSSGLSLTVFSNVSFAANDLLVVGEPKEELTELKKLDSITAKTGMTIPSALNFSHSKDTPIYKSLWDFVSIEGRSSSAGTFAELTQSAIQWDNDKGETIYHHSAGTDTWQYRFRFYNSVTATYSEYSSTLTGTGFERKMVGYMLRTIRKITNTWDQSIVSDDEIIRALNEAQDIVYAHNPKYWFLLVDTYKAGTGIAAIANTSVYSLSTYTTFGHLDSLRFRYNSGGNDEIYHLDKKSDVEFDKIAGNLNDAADDWTWIYKLLPADSSSDNGYIHIYPKTKTTDVGTLYPNYYEKMTDLEDVADETQIPFPKILEEWGIGFVYQLKGDETKAKIYQSGLISDNEDKVPRYLLLLDKMDRQQKMAQKQARNLWNFKGQRGARNLFTRPFYNRDWIKESGIYDERN
jgi:hypothetical protein